SEVQEAHALAAQAEGLLLRAEAEPIPNLFINAQPYYAFPDREPRLQLQVYVPLPVYNKNQGNILAAKAEVARTRAAVGQVELRLTERLAGAHQRYQAARRQVESYRGRIVPDANEALRLVRLGYAQGDPKYDFTAVLQAQQAVIQARLGQVQAQGELWRALSEVSGLLQIDAWEGE